jgi:hypothetical protein
MTLHLSDFTFIPDSTSPEALSRGDGAVLIPAGVVSDDSRAFEVVDRQGRQVVFDGGGQLFFSDSEAGTEELVGRSYWETDETDVPCVTPCVNVVVLAASYDINDYPRPCTGCSECRA